MRQLQAKRPQQKSQNRRVDGRQGEHRFHSAADVKLRSGGEIHADRIDDDHLGDDIDGCLVEPQLAEGQQYERQPVIHAVRKGGDQGQSGCFRRSQSQDPAEQDRHDP
ncbi:hypothetical protein D3C81_2031820 [compost metagenome]